MNPQEICCPNEDCPARGQFGKGNINIHDQKKKRYRCQVCKQAFSQTKGTPFYRLRHKRELFTTVIKLLAKAVRAKPLSLPMDWMSGRSPIGKLEQQAVRESSAASG